jgi:hypothetical protein
MALLIGIAALSFGTLLSLTQAEEPKQDRKVIHLAEVSCRAFAELTLALGVTRRLCHLLALVGMSPKFVSRMSHK